MTVLRKDFDHGFVTLACKAGATFQEKRIVIDVSVRQDDVSVMLEDGETIETQMVVGCDGMRSVVAEKTNLCKKLAVALHLTCAGTTSDAKATGYVLHQETTCSSLHQGSGNRRVWRGCSQRNTA